MALSRSTRRLVNDAYTPVDRGIVAGLTICVALLLAGVLFGSGRGNFVSPTSLAIVLGGTFGATLIHFTITDIKSAWRAFRTILFKRDYSPAEHIHYLVRLSHAVRSQGLLVLEREAERTVDPFMRLALELTVDAQEEDGVRRILETEMRTSSGRSRRAVRVFEMLGGYAPAMGLIGTLIGLIRMLGSLDDPTTVGPAMALALVTTLYGAVLANMVFLPIAGKLRNRLEEEAVLKSITLEGVISLGKQENPIIVEQKLQTFLPLMAA